MKKIMGITILVVGSTLGGGLFADEWSQNDQYYFVDDDDTSAIHQAKNLASHSGLQSVDISSMQVRGFELRDEQESDLSLFEQYMSSEQ